MPLPTLLEISFPSWEAVLRILPQLQWYHFIGLAVVILVTAWGFTYYLKHNRTSSVGGNISVKAPISSGGDTHIGHQYNEK